MKNNSLLYKTFHKKKVLITGHTGFKGTWLTSWLKILGAKIVGISVDVPTKPSHFFFLMIRLPPRYTEWISSISHMFIREMFLAWNDT